jgi:hypothetical protein
VGLSKRCNAQKQSAQIKDLEQEILASMISISEEIVA